MMLSPFSGTDELESPALQGWGRLLGTENLDINRALGQSWPSAQHRGYKP
jgi:hypothetical protein